jgi:hypothetical protein
VCAFTVHEQVGFGGRSVVAQGGAECAVPDALAVAAGAGEDGEDVFEDFAGEGEACVAL